MGTANEILNSQSLGNLEPTKIFALLSLPPEDREDFIKDNQVEDMSKRELQQAIKEKKKLERQLI
jgi:hypothetical protein